MLAFIWNLAFFAIALGILVTVHEAGHFAAAKFCKVKVQRFSIGFGKVLIKHTGRDGCEYAVSAIPLGGYVKMRGENDHRVTREEGSFRGKSLKQRAFIIAAGPLCNVILAFVLYVIVNLMGVPALLPVASDVIPGSPAARAGMVSGSLITEAGGAPAPSRSEGSMELVSAVTGGGTLELKTVPWKGQGAEGTYSIDVSRLYIEGREDPVELMGLRRSNGTVHNELSMVQPGSPADQAGLKSGDQITAVNGVATPVWYRVFDAVRRSGGRTLDFTVQREGKLYESQITPRMVYSKDLGREIPQIGAGVSSTPDPDLMHEISYSFSGAVAKAATGTWRMSRLVAQACVRLISGAVSAEAVSGPIAIAKGAGESAASGAVFFISFLAVISVNLGILNLLPIPVLDGGQLMFIAYEAVKGRAPSGRIQYALTLMGVSILLGLMMLAVFNDIRGL